MAETCRNGNWFIERLNHSPRNLATHWCSPRINIPHSRQKLRGADGFKQIAAGSGAKAVQNCLAVIVASQHEHRGFGSFGASSFSGHNPPHSSQDVKVHVHENNPGLDLVHLFQRLLGTSNVPTHLTSLWSKHRLKVATDACVVFHNSYGNWHLES